MSTFAFTWAMWVPVAIASRDRIDLGPAYDVMWLLGGFGPSVVAFALVSWAGGWPAAKRLGARLLIWRVGALQYAVALLLIPAMALTAVAIHTILGGSVPEDANLRLWYVLPGVLIASLLLGPLSEEFGWRGYLQPRLQRLAGALVATLVIGVFWVLWHLPLFFIVDIAQGDGSFTLFAVHGIAFTVLFTWLHNRSRGSVLMAVLLHASINSTFWLVPAQAELRLYLLYIALTWVVAVAVTIRGLPNRDGAEGERAG